MNKNTLCKLPSLVDILDENLSIHLTDFLNHSLFIDHKIHKEKLIEVLKKSKIFVWDYRTGLIKLKEKADRNILIVSNCTYDIENIKHILLNINKLYINKIKNIEKFEISFHIIFDHEDTSMEIEKILNSKKDQFEGFRNAQIFLAAESLKRRLLANMDENYKDLKIQHDLVSSLIDIDKPTRRLTDIDKSIPKQDILKRISNNSDIVSNQIKLINSAINSRKSYLKVNKFDNFNLDDSRRDSVASFYKNLRNSICSNTENKATFLRLNSKDKNRSSLLTSFMNKRMSDMDGSYDWGKRVSSSVGRRESNISGKYNFNSSIKDFNFKDISYLNDMFDLNSSTMYSKIFMEGDIRGNNEIKYTYEMIELISVYNHMKFLEQFEMPEVFEDNFLPNIMRQEVKPRIINYKSKNEFNRERYNTETLTDKSNRLSLLKTFNYRRASKKEHRYSIK